MTGVLILAHGSKRKETEETMKSIKEKVQAMMGDMPIEVAFLQFSKRDLHSGVNLLAMKGCKHIKMVPFFIFEGVHVSEDIPKEMAEVAQEFPEITLEMTRHLGDDTRLAEIVVDRINGK